MWVDDGFVVRFSSRLHPVNCEEDTALTWLTSFDGRPLLLPSRFAPDPMLLQRHANRALAR
jgi:hypothetical protein